MKEAISQKGNRFYFDVLVIGSGIAGLSYILDLIELKPHCKVALFSKTKLDYCNSGLAQGGIAAVTEKYDSVEKHIVDTLKAGDGACDPLAVKQILSCGRGAIETLIKRHVRFDKDELAKEGGHSERRIYHAGDATGHEIIRALIREVKRLPQVTLFENHTAINLITKKRTKSPEAIGAYVLDEKENKVNTFLAKATVLATGGAGKIFRYTSNLDVATGDGIAMAYRAGASVSNLEFYQFHPTLLYNLTNQNFLITEALRGEGAHLLNPDTHERFMKRYAPKQMELATRDIVARAIFNEIEKSRERFVYLDVRHKKQAYLKQRFPHIFSTLASLGINMGKDLIPVVPAAHYLCGGVLTDIAGQTEVKRLFAIGETACTGFHGANRLASNSLLEGAVMAHFAAKASTLDLENPLKYNKHQLKDWRSETVIDKRRANQINAHWRGLRGEMTAYAGIIRTESGLNDLHRLIHARRKMIEEYYWKHMITRDLIELRNIVLVAELIVESAIKRKESRGGHYREDYPKKKSQFRKTIMKI